MTETDTASPAPQSHHGLAPFSQTTDRVFAVLVLLTAIGIVYLLGSVEPDHRGHGTHEQLGLDPCGWPQAYGKPCPTCGATTAATWLVHGRPDRALQMHAFGAMVAALGLLGTWHALWSLIRRDSFGLRLARLPLRRIAVLLPIVLLFSWAWNWWTWES
ncbi:MAG: DUF2752 domain-containing protein [Planctomycetota bacterium]